MKTTFSSPVATAEFSKFAVQSEKTRLEADCGSDHELLIAKFRLKLKKLGETTKTFSESESPSVMSDSL